MAKRTGRLPEPPRPRAARRKAGGQARAGGPPAAGPGGIAPEAGAGDRGLRWAYGIQPVLEALKREAGRVEKIWIAFGRSGPAVRQIVDLARRRKRPVTFLDRSSLDAKAGTPKHQGVVALLSDFESLELKPFLRRLPKEGSRFLVLLDRVQDPHNLGAILRTACAAGVEGVLLPRYRTSPLTPAAMKASAGAAEWIPLVRVGNAAEALRVLRARGIRVLGADAGAGDRVYDWDLRQDVCLVIGGEGTGLRPVLRQVCDGLVSVPMVGPIDSLNASVAAAVLIYEVVRQRGG